MCGSCRWTHADIVLALAGTVGLFAGFVARIAYANQLTLGPYIAMTLFLLLPQVRTSSRSDGAQACQCFTFAAAYRLLGRMALSLGDDVSRQTLLVRATLVAKIFVASDVITFLVRCAVCAPADGARSKRAAVD